MDCNLPGSWNSPGKNVGVGSHPLLQGIFLAQESSPGLPHCRQVLHVLSHQRSSTVDDKLMLNWMRSWLSGCTLVWQLTLTSPLLCRVCRFFCSCLFLSNPGILRIPGLLGNKEKIVRWGDSAPWLSADNLQSGWMVLWLTKPQMSSLGTNMECISKACLIRSVPI